ncbi:MoxR family ATPase [archaeon]|nr:MoxR family ATPase [archaeon]
MVDEITKQKKKGIKLSAPSYNPPIDSFVKKKVIKKKKKDSKKDIKKIDKVPEFGYSGLSGVKKDIIRSAHNIEKIKKEMKKVVIGQEKVVNDLLICLLCEGSVLLEGVPGIAKTLIMKAMAASVGCKSKRIQFTADLLPTDITGFVAYSRHKGFFVVKGPVFANFVLADEINRGSPKVQSALMEVMQEKQVTIGKKTFHLAKPFLVLATENPLETRGVYKLPEAQIDRFFFKIIVYYPSREEEELIMDTNVSYRKFEDYKLVPVVSPREIIRMQEIIKKIFVHPKVKRYIAEIVELSRPNKKTNDVKTVNKYVSWGASPRAAINLYLASRANALLHGRDYVTPQDVKDISHNVLRHRLLLNYQGQIDNIKTEDIINDIFKVVKVP